MKPQSEVAANQAAEVKGINAESENAMDRMGRKRGAGGILVRARSA